MTAEMQIRLIDDNPEAQRAFNDPLGQQSRESPVPLANDRAGHSSHVSDAMRQEPPSQPSGEVTNLADMSTEELEAAIAEAAKTQKTTAETLTESVENFSRQVDRLVSDGIRIGDGDKGTTGKTGVDNEPPVVEPPITNRERGEQVIQKLQDKTTAAFRDATSSIRETIRKHAPEPLNRVVDAISRRFAGVRQGVGNRLHGLTNWASNTRAGQAVGRFANRAGLTRAAGQAQTAAGGAAAGGTAITAIGRASVIAAPIVGALAGAAKAAYDLLKSIGRAQRDLETHSADLQLVAAQTQVRRELGRIDRAQRMGPALAEFQDVRNRLEDALDEAQYRIFERLLKGSERFLPLLERIASAAEAGASAIPVTNTELKTLMDDIIARVVLSPDELARKQRLDKSLAAIQAGLLQRIGESDDDPLMKDVFDGWNLKEFDRNQDGNISLPLGTIDRLFNG